MGTHIGNSVENSSEEQAQNEKTEIQPPNNALIHQTIKDARFQLEGTTRIIRRKIDPKNLFTTAKPKVRLEKRIIRPNARSLKKRR